MMNTKSLIEFTEAYFDKLDKVLQWLNLNKQ